MPGPTLAWAAWLRLAVSVLASLYSLAIVVGGHWRGAETALALLVVLGLCFPLLLGNRRPYIALGIMLSSVVVQIATATPFAPGDFLVFVGVYDLAARRNRRDSALGAVLAVVVIASAVLVHSDEWSIVIPFGGAVGCVLVAWLWGVNTSLSWAYQRALVAQAEQARREQDQTAQLVACEERTRIARDLHDVVSHSLASILVLSDGLLRSAPDLDDRSRRTLGTISAACRNSLAEFRGTLRLMRHPPTDTPPAQAQGLGLVSAIKPILRRVGEAGMKVELNVTGDPKSLSQTAGDAVVKLVQEATTNVFKHGGKDVNRVAVTLDYHARGLDVQVADDGAGCSSSERVDSCEGFGLLGMQERFESLDGDLTVHTSPGGGFRLDASIPRKHFITSADGPDGTRPPWTASAAGARPARR